MKKWRREYNFPMTFGCTFEQAEAYVKWLEKEGLVMNNHTLNYFMKKVWNGSKSS